MTLDASIFNWHNIEAMDQFVIFYLPINFKLCQI